MKSPQQVGCILCLLSIGVGWGCAALLQQYTTGATTKSSCEADNTAVAGSSCHVWQPIDDDQGQCRKGTVNTQLECVSRGHLGPLLLGIASTILFCTGAYYCCCAARTTVVVQAPAQTQV